MSHRVGDVLFPPGQKFAAAARNLTKFERDEGERRERDPRFDERTKDGSIAYCYPQKLDKILFSRGGSLN